MVDLDLVKRRRKKKIAAATAMISSVVLGVLMIVAFLGREVGTFTISLDNHNVQLALAERRDSKEESTYLRVGDVPSFSGAFTYNWFTRQFPFENVDSETTSPLYGATYDREGNVNGIRFFKYTYYVRNVGDQNAKYNTYVDITNLAKPSNVAYDLSEYLRVAVFEDGDMTIFARTSAQKIGHKDPITGEVSYSEPIYADEDQRELIGYCEDFESNERVCTYAGSIDAGQQIRYTVLFWLEGQDPECKVIPRDATISFGVDVEGFAA